MQRENQKCHARPAQPRPRGDQRRQPRQQPVFHDAVALGAEGLPFGDEGHGLVAGDHRQIDGVVGEAIGRGQSRRRGEYEKDQPFDQQGPVSQARGLGYGQKGKAGDNQRKSKTAMQIGPQHHQRQQPVFRWLLPRRRAKQPRRQNHHGQQREDMGPGNHHRRQHHGTDEDNGRRDLQTQVLSQFEIERYQRRGHGQHRKQHDAAPATGLEGQGQQHLRQPFLGDPWLSVEGIGIVIGIGHTECCDDVAPGLNMPPYIGVAQHDCRAQTVIAGGQQQQHQAAQQRELVRAETRRALHT